MQITGFWPTPPTRPQHSQSITFHFARPLDGPLSVGAGGYLFKCRWRVENRKIIQHTFPPSLPPLDPCLWRWLWNETFCHRTLSHPVWRGRGEVKVFNLIILSEWKYRFIIWSSISSDMLANKSSFERRRRVRRGGRGEAFPLITPESVDKLIFYLISLPWRTNRDQTGHHST